MAWGRNKKSGAPKWSQDEYHKEFASQIREPDQGGGCAVAETLEARRDATPGERRQREGVPRRELALLERGANRQGVLR